MRELSSTLIQTIQEQKRHQPICAYYYDLEHLRQHLKHVMTALPANCQMFYAMKANSEPRILETVAQAVHGFEVASLGEIEKARQVDSQVPLMFGGPGKTDAELRGAIAHQVQRVHVESLHELQRLNGIARTLDQKVSILLRVNLRGPFPHATLQMAGRPTQFGIDETELDSAIQRALSCSHLKLEGFHLHSISNQLDANQHLALIEAYCDRIATWNQAHGLALKVLNVGGGIGVNYAQPDQSFEWTKFTAGLAALLNRRKFQDLNLIFECGRFLTATCGYYGVEVLDIKCNHGKTFVIVRGGTQHFRLPVSWNHNHPFRVIPMADWPYPFERPAMQQGLATIVGQLCTPKDVFARDVQIERLRAGDVILFTHAGAYGWSISHHDFLSHPHPEQVYLETTPSQSPMLVS